jgi:hypothetical protein
MKTKYQVNHNGPDSQQVFENLDSAEAYVERVYGSDVIYQDDWDCDGYDDKDREISRKLVWASEEDADNDSGQNSLCEIRRVPC